MAPKRPNPSTASSSKPSQPLPKSFFTAQAKKAVDALLKHANKVSKEREETELLSREEHVFLNINTKSPTTRKKLMPVKIQLPHPPLPPPPTTSVCLITKDPQRQYKDLIAAQNIKFISRVVGLEKLKGKFKPFEARRALMRDHEIWLCDDRIIPIMPKVLGKMFFEAKKAPIPVNLQRKDLKTELANAISSTYYHPSTGTSHSIRISTVSSTNPSQTLENLLAALPPAIAQIQGEWDNVLSIGVKTSSSVLLPIWNSHLSDRFKSGTEGGVTEAGSVDVEMDGTPKSKKGKKPLATALAELSADLPKKIPADEVEKKAVSKKNKEESKGDKIVKKSGKKSSTIGSGGAGKKAKASILGKA